MFGAKKHNYMWDPHAMHNIIPIITTREQTLERCPNLALASTFFAPGTKGPFSPSW